MLPLELERQQILKADGVEAAWANQTTPLPATPATELIDDFERADGRSSLDTLRLLDMDGGVERSAVVTNLVPALQGGSALAIAVQMSPKDKPEGGVLVPLTRGSVRPVDARRFSGVRLKLRGSGRYTVVVNTLAGEWTASVDATTNWSDIRVPFTALAPTRNRAGAPAWRGDDLVEVGVVVRREASTAAWGEIDDLGFYES